MTEKAPEYTTISEKEWDKMSESPSDVKFSIDGTPHALEGELLPPPIEKKDGDEEHVRRPISRAAAVKSLGSSIGAVHWVGAKVLNEPSLELSKDEKKVYGEVTVDLLKVYGIDLATHPKASAWVNFGVVALEVDGPRLVLMMTKPPSKKYTEEEEGEPPPLVFPER